MPASPKKRNTMTTAYAICAASFQAGILLTLAAVWIHAIITKRGAK
jgi:hypothetical protein